MGNVFKDPAKLVTAVAKLSREARDGPSPKSAFVRRKPIPTSAQRSKFACKRVEMSGDIGKELGLSTGFASITWSAWVVAVFRVIVHGASGG